MAIRKRQWKSGGATKTAWVCDYADQHGGRHIRTFPTKGQASKWWSTEGAISVHKGTHTAKSTSKTVREAADLWLERCRQGTADFDPLEPATMREYERHVDQYIAAKVGIGTRKLSELTFADVTAFEGRLKKAGKSAAMIRKVRASLSALISDAMANGLVGRHVIRDAQRERGRRRRKDRTKKEIAIPTKAELNTLLEKAGEDFKPFLVTAIFTGMRVSELRGLTWDNVDFKAEVIRVRQRADRFNNLGAPKTAAGNRDIPMAPMVVNTLKAWKLKCPKGDLNLVFPSGRRKVKDGDGERWKGGNVQSLANIYTRQFAPLQIANGMSIKTDRKDDEGKPILAAKYGFHALRHAAVSLFIEQGFSPKKLQTLMGHSSIQMTFDTYGHLFHDAESDAQAFEQIQARLVG